jgi:predicted patatin/cPLA2 family phospholipase
VNRLGLILEGGGMRGVYTAGVLDCMADYKLWTDGIIGVSAGATHGCNFRSRQRGRNYRIDVEHSQNPKFMGVRSLLTTGDYFGADFCYRYLPDELDPFDYKTFQRAPSEFYAVCTDLETGSAVYEQIEDLKDKMDYLRASASMPLFSKIVEVDGKKLMDGGIADSIPVRKFTEMGYAKNIVILTQPADYRKKKNKLIPLLKLVYRRYPLFLKALEMRHEVYNDSLDLVSEKEKSGELFVFRPEEIDISRVERNPEKLKAVYHAAYRQAESRLRSLKEFMELGY